MRLTAKLLAIWFVSLALGAGWAGVDVSYDTASYQEDPFIIG